MSALFRVDVSRRIGLGHLMRSLALAEEMREHDVESFFVLGESELEHARLVEERGFPAYRLRCASGGLLDATFTRSLAQRYQARLCVLDSPRFERGYYHTISREGLFILALDDRGRAIPVDLVVNPNAGAERFLYREAQVALCGLRYVPLRRKLLDIAPGVERRGVLLSLGGTAPAEATARILRLLPRAPQQITAIYSGDQTTSMASAIDLASAMGHRITLLRGFQEMLPLMRRAERAITAAGGTLLELAYLGVPTLSLAVTEEQIHGAWALSRAGVTSYGGLLSSLSDGDLRAALANFLQSSAPVISTQVIDGKGAKRIVEAALLMLSGRAAPEWYDGQCLSAES